MKWVVRQNSFVVVLISWKPIKIFDVKYSAQIDEKTWGKKIEIIQKKENHAQKENTSQAKSSTDN